jgi:hypothetical protein
MYLERLKGRKSKALENMVNDPMIVELKNGKVYGGRLDGHYYYGGGVIALYYCKLLDKSSHKWVDHDMVEKFEGELISASMPDFWIAEIRDIFVLHEEYRDKLDLEDTLQIYIDPHYKPLMGIQCNWSHEENHAPECDAHLHEALSFLMTLAHSGISSSSKTWDEDKARKLKDDHSYIRRRLLMFGAKIP